MKPDIFFYLNLLPNVVLGILALIWFLKDRRKHDSKYQFWASVFAIFFVCVNYYKDNEKEQELIEINKKQDKEKNNRIQSLEREKNILNERLIICLNERNGKSSLSYLKPYFQKIFMVDDFTNTKIRVEKGDRILINASGTINVGPVIGHSGPDGKESGIFGFSLLDYNIIKSYKHASLIFKVDDGNGNNWTNCGVGCEMNVEQAGFIYFDINDIDKRNNSGKYKVSLKIFR